MGSRTARTRESVPPFSSHHGFEKNRRPRSSEGVGTVARVTPTTLSDTPRDSTTAIDRTRQTPPLDFSTRRSIRRQHTHTLIWSHWIRFPRDTPPQCDSTHPEQGLFTTHWNHPAIEPLPRAPHGCLIRQCHPSTSGICSPRYMTFPLQRRH